MGYESCLRDGWWYYQLSFPSFDYPETISDSVIGKRVLHFSQKELDKSLIFGALLFGIGWGLGGYCPGPAITSLGTGSLSAILFVLSMGLGMLIADRVISPFFFLSGKKPNTVN